MRVFPTILFGALLLAAALLIPSLAGKLPDIVAVHFNAAGNADGFATREGCRAFMFAFTLGAPLLLAAVTAGLPRLLPASLINIPNRGYWLAPSRAAQTVAFMSEQGIWFGCIFLLFLCDADWMLVKANSSVPPALDSRQFIWLLVLFFCALGALMVRMFRRFRTP
jgi:Protein of unknown function (DUF1648)